METTTASEEQITPTSSVDEEEEVWLPRSSISGCNRQKLTTAKKGTNVRFSTQPVTGSETQETIVMVDSIAVGGNATSLTNNASLATSGTVAELSRSTPSRPTAQYTTSTQAARRRDRSEQREMRATIRMAVIIGVFCAMWLSRHHYGLAVMWLRSSCDLAVIIMAYCHMV